MFCLLRLLVCDKAPPSYKRGGVRLFPWASMKSFRTRWAFADIRRCAFGPCGALGYGFMADRGWAFCLRRAVHLHVTLIVFILLGILLGALLPSVSPSH